MYVKYDFLFSLYGSWAAGAKLRLSVIKFHLKTDYMQDWLASFLYSMVTISLAINIFTLRLNGLKVNYFTKYVIYNIWMELAQQCLILMDLLNAKLGDPSPFISWLTAFLRVTSAELGFLFSTMFLLVGLSVFSGKLNSKVSVPSWFVIVFGISYSLLCTPYGKYQPIASTILRNIYYISMWSVRVVVGLCLVYQLRTTEVDENHSNRASQLMLQLIIAYAITDYISAIPMILLDMGFQHPVFFCAAFMHLLVKAVAHYLVISYHINITKTVPVSEPTEGTSLIQQPESIPSAMMRNFANASGLFDGFEQHLRQDLADELQREPRSEYLLPFNNSNTPTVLAGNGLSMFDIF